MSLIRTEPHLPLSAIEPSLTFFVVLLMLATIYSCMYRLSISKAASVRATASGFCYHQGAIWAGFTGSVLTYFAVSQPTGFAVPMLIATTGAAVMFVITLLYSPETKGKELVSHITLLQPAE
jgi:hypothetical protein